MECQISVIKEGCARQLLSLSVVWVNHGTTIQNPLPRGAGYEPLIRNNKGHFWDGSNQYTDLQQWNSTEQQSFIPPEATSGKTIANGGHVMGLSVHYSKIWCLGILNILSGRILTSGRCREDSELPLPTLLQLFLYWRKGVFLSLKTTDRQTGESKCTDLAFSPVYYSELIAFRPMTFSRHFPSFIKPSIETLRLNHFFGFSFPY